MVKNIVFFTCFAITVNEIIEIIKKNTDGIYNEEGIEAFVMAAEFQLEDRR